MDILTCTECGSKDLWLWDERQDKLIYRCEDCGNQEEEEKD